MIRYYEIRLYDGYANYTTLEYISKKKTAYKEFKAFYERYTGENKYYQLSMVRWLFNKEKEIETKEL